MEQCRGNTGTITFAGSSRDTFCGGSAEASDLEAPAELPEFDPTDYTSNVEYMRGAEEELHDMLGNDKDVHQGMGSFSMNAEDRDVIFHDELAELIQ